MLFFSRNYISTTPYMQDFQSLIQSSYFLYHNKGLCWIRWLNVKLLVRSTKRGFWESFMNRWEEKTWNMKKTTQGFFNNGQRIYCPSRRFWRVMESSSLKHPPYSLDLSPCDFLFSKIKSELSYFEFIYVVKIKGHKEAVYMMKPSWYLPSLIIKCNTSYKSYQKHINGHHHGAYLAHHSI